MHLRRRATLVYGTAHDPCKSVGRQSAQGTLVAQELRSTNNRYEAWQLKAISASKVEQLLHSKIRSMETQ